jgi:hypothetical protein
MRAKVDVLRGSRVGGGVTSKLRLHSADMRRPKCLSRNQCKSSYQKVHLSYKPLPGLFASPHLKTAVIYQAIIYQSTRGRCGWTT